MIGQGFIKSREEEFIMVCCNSSALFGGSSRPGWSRRRGARSPPGGFSLMELMIVLAVISILVAIAVPSYTEYVLRGKRAEARAALMDAAARQERHYSDNYEYAQKFSDLGVGKSTESGQYTLSMALTAKAAAQGFTLSAVPQFTDADCGSLTITQVGTRGVTKGTVQNCWGK